ncbi:MAG: ABC transporter ATP-binding protein [Polyangiales bacterium]
MSAELPADPAIAVQGAVKRFGAGRGLDGLDLAVPRGSVFALLGPNGAGKTTTLRLLLGLLRAEQGTVRVLGVDPTVEPERVRASVGVLLEHDGLYDRLSAHDNLRFFARAHRLGKETERRVEELLGEFGLWERRADPVVTWSKGMRQKLAIARSLLQRPRLVLLDEPFSALDPAASVDLRARLVALAREQETTVFMTTHDLAHVAKVCDEVAVLRRGRIVAAGVPDELGRERDAGLVMRVAGEGLRAEILDAMKSEGLIVSYTLEGETASVHCPPSSRAKLGVELVRRGVALEELHLVQRTLEDAFLSLMNEEEGR